MQLRGGGAVRICDNCTPVGRRMCSRKRVESVRICDNCKIPRVKTLNQLIFIPIRVAKEQFVPSEQSHLCCVCGSQFFFCVVCVISAKEQFVFLVEYMIL